MNFKCYGFAFFCVIVATATGIIFSPLFNLKPVDQIMIYLMGCVVVASYFGRGPAILYSLLSANAFNFFFIEPLHSFVMYERSYWTSLIVMLVTSYVIADQASRLRQQAILALKHDRDTQSFYSFARNLAATTGYTNIAQAAAQHIEKYFEAKASIWLCGTDSDQEQRLLVGHPSNKDAAADTGKDSLYFPLVTGGRRIGILGIFREKVRDDFSPESASMLETLANLLASAFERVRAAEMAERANVDTEKEKLRNVLLSSISHDLRTPLASIIGSSSSILADIERLTKETVIELIAGIHQEAQRLSRIVGNILDVTRLESGNLQLNLQPYFIEELIGAALTQTKSLLAKHHITTKAQSNMPMVMVDGTLIEQVLVNLLTNAARYTPEEKVLTISACLKGDNLLIAIADEGVGIPTGEEKKIFDKFYTVGKQKGRQGAGLGLAVCHGIIIAHHGEIWAQNQATGGACFYFTLPTYSLQKGEADGSNGLNSSD